MNTDCFLGIYEKDIASRLRDIDILLKTSESHIDISEVENLLGLSDDEISLIMKECRLAAITKKDFLEIMKKGSSYICRLYQRELECGSPYIYKKSEIAYIYGIDIQDINDACHALGIEEVTSGILPLLFSQIKTASYKFRF